MPKISIRIILLSLSFLSCLSIQSQNTEQILEVGHDYYAKGDFLGANKVYEQAMDIDSSNTAVLYYYSKSLMDLMQMEKASRYLFKASLIDKGEQFPDIYFLLAESYRGTGDYRKARRYYSKAMIPYRSDRKSYWYKKIDQSKDANQWAMKQNISSKELNVFDKQFNTEASEFGARVIDGQLYFSSLRADSLEDGDILNDLEYYTKIYHSNLDQQSSAVELKVKDPELIKKHLANISIAKDAKTAYFSVCDTNYNCEIWKGEIVNNELINTTPLNNNINFPNHNNTQPEILEYRGQEYILFSSNRPKGFGGLDLWISEKKEFGFDEAINLGAGINTEGNEITPFYKEGWLYFSSDWHLGFGGYDIFKTSGWISKFTEVQNMGSPINSPTDDYYFSRANDQAILASNRDQATTQNFCCNDLYYTPYDEESILDDMQEVEDTVVADIVTLNKYLPLDLYFHNDMPDPNSKDSTTQENYMDLANSYTAMKEEYLTKIEGSQQYVKNDELKIEVESFFEDQLASGVSDLEFFTPILLRSLEAGNQIELSIKGFASSLSGADYNLNLTLRRIESLINYFKTYKNGAFLPYLNNSTDEGGSLKIKKIPFGEFAINDNELENDKIMAVYSKQAALQRKIELIAVSNQDGSIKRFDSQETYSPPKISFNSRAYKLGEISTNELNRSFIVKNEGGEDLKIYNIMINCDDCAIINYPKKLTSKEEGKIDLKINIDSMEGDMELKITVVSNTVPNINELSIQFNK